MSVFGTILDASLVEARVRDMLAEWLPDYITEVETQREDDPEYWARPADYVTRTEFDKWPEERIPVILVICPGLFDEPQMRGDGQFTARWQVGIASIVSAKGPAETDTMAKVYTAAVRAAMLQQKSMGQRGATGVAWLSEKYDDVPSVKSRSLAAGQATFWVQFDDVVNGRKGPRREPAGEPHLDDPTVESYGSTATIRRYTS